MKKNLLIMSFVLFSALFVSSCGQSPAKEKASTKKEVVKVQYTCPMHAEVISDKPGDCPKCGMALVEKK
jgi:PBP1b-binding outer membrane lipoprotein LpoB